MELSKALEELDLLQKKMYAYNAASTALFLDGETVAPKKSSEGRGVALSILAGESQKIFTAPEVGELLTFLAEHRDEITHEQRRQVEELTRSYKQLSLIPADEYMEYTMVTNEAGAVWHDAKEQSDFSLFCPLLEKIVEFNRKFAGYYDSSKKPYDALLNEFERGVDMEYLDKFFATVREKLVPLIKKIGEAEKLDNSFIYKYYPTDVQRKFSDYLMEVMGVDKGHCTIGETEHPFSVEFNNKDVRITTNYKEYNLVDSMYSVIHECGHALYELGVRDDLQYTCLSNGVSMGVHESQSRFYENIIGRSREFIEAIFPKMKEFFPEQLEGITAEQMYYAVNMVEPSLIRTEADEVTYSIHVLIRYEIEKALIAGEMEVKEIPEVWNRLYQEYLGVDVPDDARGCLQDGHWSGGSFGYFPSYALGSAYGAQMLQNMEKDTEIWEKVSKGDLSAVTNWLKEKVHQYGSLLEPKDVVKNACGEFDPTAYTDYLVKKYTEIYNLEW